MNPGCLIVIAVFAAMAVVNLFSLYSGATGMVAAAAAVGAWIWVLRGSSRPFLNTTDAEGEKFCGVRLPSADGMTTEVVGESFQTDNILAAVDANEPFPGAHRTPIMAMLSPDRANPHDANAISVYVDGVKVGHIARDEAAVLGPWLRRLRTTVYCPGAICGEDDWFGVFLDLDQRLLIGHLRNALVKKIIAGTAVALAVPLLLIIADLTIFGMGVGAEITTGFAAAAWDWITSWF